MTAGRRPLLPVIAIVLAIVLALSMWLAAGGVTTASVRASTARGAWASQTISVQAQEDGAQGAPDGAAERDDRVEVQVWTIAAAGMAMALGLVALLVRMLMGWVKPAPPPQEEAHH